MHGDLGRRSFGSHLTESVLCICTHFIGLTHVSFEWYCEDMELRYVNSEFGFSLSRYPNTFKIVGWFILNAELFIRPPACDLPAKAQHNTPFRIVLRIWTFLFWMDFPVWETACICWKNSASQVNRDSELLAQERAAVQHAYERVFMHLHICIDHVRK